MGGTFVLVGLSVFLLLPAGVHGQAVAGNAVATDSATSASHRKGDDLWKGQMLLEIQLLEAMGADCRKEAKQSETGRPAALLNPGVPERMAFAKARDEKLACAAQADEAVQRMGIQLGIGHPRRSVAQGSFEQEYERGLLDIHEWFMRVVQVLKKPESDSLTYSGFTLSTQQFERQLDTFQNHYIRLLAQEDNRELAETIFEASDALIASSLAWGRQVDAEELLARLTPKDPRTARSATEAARDVAVKERAILWETVQRRVSDATILARVLRPPTIPPSRARLTEDRQTLVLIEEAGEPAAGRQPGISMGTSPTTRIPEIWVSGSGLRVPPQIEVMCRDGALPPASLSSLSEAGERKLATFALTTRVAAAMTKSSPCLLQLGDTLVPIRADLLAIVWGDLRHGAQGGDPLSWAPSADRPVFRAAREGRYADVESALMQGMSPYERGIGQETALHWAAAYGHPAVVQLLLTHGAEVDARDAGNTTPLHYAAGAGQQEVVVILLDKEADPHARNTDGMTPLHLAAAHGDVAVVNVLIAHHARVDVQDIGGTAPLHLASAYGRKEIVQALLRAGAASSLKDADGHTPLDIAQANDHAEVATMIHAVAATQ